MNFLNHSAIVKEGYGFLSGFPLSPLQRTIRTLETVRGCVSLKKYKSQGKAVDVTCE
jgi:hypothetical protein